VKIQECSNFFSFWAFSQVSNESLRSLSTLEKLEDIAMVGCLFIDDDGLQMLRAGNSLQVVTLQGCRSYMIRFVYYDAFFNVFCAYCIFNLICSRVLMYQDVST
jgi:hypothetical protein